MAKYPTIYDDETGEERRLPFVWAICPTCDGHGKSSAYLGAFTGDQMREDPEFMEDYFAGHYDRTCDECAGRGSIPVIDLDKTPKADLKLYNEQQADLAEMRAIERQEYLFCGGWREEGWY